MLGAAFSITPLQQTAPSSRRRLFPLCIALKKMLAPKKEKVANRQLAHSAALRFASFAPRLFAYTGKLAGSRARSKARRYCESKARSNASTGRPVAPGTAGRTAKKQSSSPLLPLCVLPVSARSNRCRVTLFARRQFLRLSKNFL